MDETSDRRQQRLSYDDAKDVPCANCMAGCCTFLPLHDFRITSMTELDYALYLLNFDRIELALLAGGMWRVHYRAECRNLDVVKRRCLVHQSPRQPTVCKRYDPFKCFYTRLFEGSGSDDYIRMDRQRMETYAKMLVFDGHRDVVGVPDIKSIIDALPPLQPVVDPEPLGSTVLAQWREMTSGSTTKSPPSGHRFTDFTNPCGACQAWCCTRLAFPHGTPNSVGNLDHLYFCLGFPGVEVGIDEQNQWSVVVRTRCRHRQVTQTGQGRCGVFGQPDRPNLCLVYDATLCGYKSQFAQPRPERYVRITYDDYSAVTSLFQFDSNGYVTHSPQHEQIRDSVEASWTNTNDQ